MICVRLIISKRILQTKVNLNMSHLSLIRLIVYKKSDIIIDNNADYINDALEVPKKDGRESFERNMMNNISTRTTPCAYRLILATDADYEFYQNMGNSVSNTYSYIFSILNIIEGIYQSKDEISQFLGWFGSYLQPGIVANSITLSGTFNWSFQNNSATQTITTSQFVNSGLVSYKAGTYIEFQSGFEVSANAAIYGNTENVLQCND